MYRNIMSDQFFPDQLLDWLDLSSEHQAIEIANRVEASIFIWRNRTSTKPMNSKHTRSSSKSSWDLMKELMVDSDKRELLADRAEGLLHCLKQRFPGLPQTTLDMYKLQFNKVSPMNSKQFLIPEIIIYFPACHVFSCSTAKHTSFAIH